MNRAEAIAECKRNMEASWELFTNYGLSAEDKAELVMFMLEGQRVLDQLKDEDGRGRETA